MSFWMLFFKYLSLALIYRQ